MKRFALLLIFILSGLLLAVPVYATPVSLNDVVSPVSAGPFGGGEILMQNVTTGESFYTFCLEQSVYMYGGGQYQVTNISNKVISGGTGQTAVFLDGGTKWLFYQWATGALSGYIQGDTTSKGEGALQLAIWQLQGQGFGLLQSGYDGVDFYNAAVNHRSEGNLLPVFAANPVLLGTDKEGQSFLIIQTPEPMTLILLGAGLLGLAGLRRKE